MNLIYKRGLLAGVANLILGFFINWFIGAAFPAIALEYQNTAIFRSFTDPLMMIYFAYPFILGIVLAYFWKIIKTQFEGDSLQQALGFAKLYFVIATIPGMFISYTSFQLSLAMVILWMLTGFLQAFIAGWIFATVKK